MSIILPPKSAFVEVDSTLVRGPQPSLDDLRVLQVAGVTSVINLRQESTVGEADAR